MQREKLGQEINKFTITKPEMIDVIGYGSAVKTQANDREELKKQIDIIATVDNALNWHQENLKKSKKEYNHLANLFLKEGIIHFGTDIQYISNINFDNHLYKLGIIEKNDLIDDLNNWKNFYIAGRLQKPILIIKGDIDLNKAIERNRLNALRTALILCKENNLSEEELYKIICSFSYMGDVRMKLNLENPKKISNIVSGELEEFRSIYSSLNNGLFTIDNNTININLYLLFDEIEDLPINLLEYLLKNDVNLNNQSKENLEKIRFYIKMFLQKKNYKSSIAQPIKSSLINNFSSSKTYLHEKRKKYLLNK